MKNIVLTIILSIFLVACQQKTPEPIIINNYPQPHPSETLPDPETKSKAKINIEKPAPSGQISNGKSRTSSNGRKILRTGRQMTLINKEIIVGGCWDYANAVYNRSGYPPKKRKIIFKGSKRRGPYADARLIQPGDWLYYINHSYGGIEHSAIFINWVDYKRKKGLMLSYGGERRRKPARYMPYKLTKIYQIIRPKD